MATQELTEERGLRKEGERIVVSFPHNDDFKRRGSLVKIIRFLPQGSVERGVSYRIWEVELDATPTHPKKICTYNEDWLVKDES